MEKFDTVDVLYKSAESLYENRYFNVARIVIERLFNIDCEL